MRLWQFGTAALAGAFVGHALALVADDARPRFPLAGAGETPRVRFDGGPDTGWYRVPASSAFDPGDLVMVAYAKDGRKQCSIPALEDGGFGPAIGENIKECVDWLAGLEAR
ncbi:MAG: hypothetical protein WC876_01750 [Candidatus Thermoplasmatota archaeon]|jgi:hypothetical protein